MPPCTITVVCAYCKKFIGKKVGDGVSGISHGICATCFTLTKDLVANGAKGASSNTICAKRPTNPRAAAELSVS